MAESETQQPERVTARHRRAPSPPRRGSVLVVALVAAAVIASGVILLTRQSGQSGVADANGGRPSATRLASAAPRSRATSRASSAVSPSVSPSAAASSAASSAAGSAAGYVLSAPGTAGGYPAGNDPQFIGLAAPNAQTISSSVAGADAGSIASGPVSAPYELPIGGQVLAYFGYQGTFTPARVMAMLSTLGTDQHDYPAGSHGGELNCFNLFGNDDPADPETESATICVWATTSTLGVTEFFSSSGPEVLTSSQGAGAAIVEKLRSGVETAKS